MPESFPISTTATKTFSWSAGVTQSLKASRIPARCVGVPQAVALVNVPPVNVLVRCVLHTACVSVGAGSVVDHPVGTWFSDPVPPVGVAGCVAASRYRESVSVVVVGLTVTSTVASTAALVPEVAVVPSPWTVAVTVIVRICWLVTEAGL